MPDMLHMEIAGIPITVMAAEADHILETDPAKRSFIRFARSLDEEIHVTILNEPAGQPDTGRMTKLFDTGQAWVMHHSEKSYCMTLKPRTDKPALWTITTTPDFSRVTAYCGPSLVETKNGKTSLPNPITYPLDQILLMHYLALRQGILLHAAGLVARDCGFIFAGRSGAGKTSLARRLGSEPALRFLSDDRILVRKTGERIMAYGTPWPGEGGIAENACAPLQAIFFIVHGQTTSVTPIDPRAAVKRLLPIASIPWYDREVLPSTLQLCEDIAVDVPAYDLHITPDIEVMNALEPFISG